MQRVIKLQEVEEELNNQDEINEPIVVKRDNKSDVVIVSVKEYKEKLLELDIINIYKNRKKI